MLACDSTLPTPLGKTSPSALATDLVSRKVDVIAATGGDAATRAAKNATSAIPVVFITGSDPVELGVVASFARPGGNLTGVTILTGLLMSKRFELISELVPQIGVIVLLVNPNNALPEPIIRDLQEAARAKAVQLHILKAGAEGEFESAFATLVQLGAGALLVAADPFFFSRREQLAVPGGTLSVPAIYEWREFPEAGGLISYGTSLASMYRRAGAYVGKILQRRRR